MIITCFFNDDNLGASPAVPKAPSIGEYRLAVGGRAFRGYAIAPVLCSLLRRLLASERAKSRRNNTQSTKPLQSLARSPRLGINELVTLTPLRSFYSGFYRRESIFSSSIPTLQGVPHPSEAFVLCSAVLGRYHSATATVRASLWPTLH